MENERLTRALEMIEDLKAEKGLSQEQAAKLIGFSGGSIISQLKSGSYIGNVDAQLDKIERYFKTKDEQKQAYREPEYVETSISSKVYSVIKVCRIKGGLASFSGDAGIGKTKAAIKFLRDNPGNTVYITMNPCFRSVKSLLKLIADQMGVRHTGGIDDMWIAIRNRISDGMVWIFDEAQHLTYNAIETIRAFSDDCASSGKTLGICLIGNIDVNRKLSAFAQLDNRTKLKPTCTTSKIKREDIALLFPILAQNNMEAEINFLWGVSQVNGIALRGAIALFGNAYDGNDYTLNGLVKAAKAMGMDIKGLDLKKIRGAA